MTEQATTCKGASLLNGDSWHSINWRQCYREVRRLQARIVKATRWSTGTPNRAAISVAGSDMSVESLLMCCGGNWNGLPRQMTMSCRKSPDLRG